jgi:hypothetical protein
VRNSPAPVTTLAGLWLETERSLSKPRSSPRITWLRYLPFSICSASWVIASELYRNGVFPEFAAVKTSSWKTDLRLIKKSVYA